MDKLKEYIKKFQEVACQMDYNDTVPLLKEIEIFLMEKIKEEPNNIDYILAFASVRMELRYGEEDAIKWIEDFFNKNKNSLTNEQKARIYTNLAFYYSESYEPEKEIVMLELAQKMESKYYQTYYALGLYYFDEEKNYPKAKIMFKNAYDLLKCPESIFNYGVALYMTQEYQKAKTMFQTVFSENTQFEYVDLALAYCEIRLGNRDKALKILESLNVNEYTFFISSGFFVLDEYKKCLNIYESENLYRGEEDFLYSAFLYNQPLFENVVKDNLEELENDVKEYQEKVITEKYTQEEKQDDIEYFLGRLKTFKLLVADIRQGIKPNCRLELFPKFGCYLIDCIRHQKI